MSGVVSTAAILICCLLAVPAGIARTNPPVKAVEPPIAYSAYNAHPKLVVILVIDQFRGDYLERYHADFKGRGFRLFLDRGAYFPDCYYDYANTKTAPGHATLGTGAYTDGHGINSNEWWDLDRNKERPISSVEDERYRQVGAPDAPIAQGGAASPARTADGASPRNLLASTVGDELRLATQGQSSVYGISLKDRASILPAGSAANAAYWIDQASGYFVTSTYYTAQLPAWATAFNTSGRIEQAYKDSRPAAALPVDSGLADLKQGSAKPEKKTGSNARTTRRKAPEPPNGEVKGEADVTTGTEKAAVTPPAYRGPTGKGFYGMVGSTPAANSYELDFAKALIQGEQLGHHATTDLVTISLSANDIMGHQAGPDSTYQREMVDGLDTEFDSFFTWLDKNVDGGLANVWITLSADHGIAPIPAEASKLGMPSAPVDLSKLSATLNDAINLKFSPGEKVDYLLPHQELPYLQLNRPAFERDGVNETEAEEAVQKALPAAVESLSAPAPPPATESAPAPGAGAKPAPSEVRLAPRPTLVHSYTRLQLAAGELPPSEWGTLLAHSYSPNGGWYVMTIFADYQMESLSGATKTTHFSPWSYDRHVPLAFYGAPFLPGVYRGRVAPVDLAPTLASLLGINQPSASVGHVLTQALRPAAAVTYPLPVFARPARRSRSISTKTTTEADQAPDPSSAPVTAPVGSPAKTGIAPAAPTSPSSPSSAPPSPAPASPKGKQPQ